MTTYGYARVSTTGQHLSEQVKALKSAGVDHIEHDHGVTGTTMERKGLTALLGQWDGKSFTGGLMQAEDTLMVLRLDRLGRTTLGMIELADRLSRSGMNLRTVEDGIDTTTPMGRMTFTVMAALAQMESEIRAERAREGRARAKDNGHSLGGRPVEYNAADIERAVRQVRAGSKSAASAARDLGMSRSGFYKRVKTSGLELRPA